MDLSPDSIEAIGKGIGYVLMGGALSAVVILKFIVPYVKGKGTAHNGTMILKAVLQEVPEAFEGRMVRNEEGLKELRGDVKGGLARIEVRQEENAKETSRRFGEQDKVLGSMQTSLAVLASEAKNKHGTHRDT